MTPDSDVLTGGTAAASAPTREVRCEVGKYVVKVQLTPQNEFLGVVEVSIRKDFRTQEQRIRATAYHDASESYES
jgi:hypothetical protein